MLGSIRVSSTINEVYAMDLTNKQIHILNKLVKGAIETLEQRRTMKGSIERLNVLYELDIATKVDGIVEELKPCPFCGNPTTLQDTDVDGGNCYSHSYFSVVCKCMNLAVHCDYYDKNKSLHGTHDTKYNTRDKAKSLITNKWNIRGGN